MNHTHVKAQTLQPNSVWSGIHLIYECPLGLAQSADASVSIFSWLVVHLCSTRLPTSSARVGLVAEHDKLIIHCQSRHNCARCSFEPEGPASQQKQSHADDALETNTAIQS